jgi:hypothetical protein
MVLNMKKKVIAILVSLLFIAMIPSTIGDDCEPEQEDKIIFMRGLLFHKLRKGNVNIAIAIHLVVWYNTSEGIVREVYWFETVYFRDSAYLGRMYEVCLGLFTYVFGYFSGGLEPLE